MKRNILTKQVKTLSATAAVLLAYVVSFPAGIAAETGGVNAYDNAGSGYHVPQTHDSSAPPVSSARAPALVRDPDASKGGVNAFTETGAGNHVPTTHDAAAPQVSRLPAPALVRDAPATGWRYGEIGNSIQR